MDIRLTTKAKKDCLKGGVPIDHLRKALKEELEGKTMISSTDELYIGFIYGKRPIMAIGKQYDGLFIAEEVNLETTLIFASEGGEPSIIHMPDHWENKNYSALKEIRNIDKLLDAAIEDLDLSARTYNRLYIHGITRIGDVISRSGDYYRVNRILQPNSLAELKGRLLGLNLGFNKDKD